MNELSREEGALVIALRSLTPTRIQQRTLCPHMPSTTVPTIFALTRKIAGISLWRFLELRGSEGAGIGSSNS